jgi:hypothetical protein
VKTVDCLKLDEVRSESATEKLYVVDCLCEVQ